MITDFKSTRFLLPALIAAVLIGTALYGYESPALPDVPDEVQAQESKAQQKKKPKIKVPKLEPAKAPEKRTSVPAGTPGQLGAADESGDYKDGTYTGTAQGFGGPITVKVTIKDGRITKVELVSAPNEDAAFFNKAKVLLGVIARKQTTNVDAVSGATYSSNGIIMAARNALAKAKGEKTSETDKSKKKDTAQKDKNKNPKKSRKKPKAVTGGKWADGTYTGTGEGFEGPVTVAVTIRDGKIKSVKIKKTEDDEPYFTNAKKSILPAVVKVNGTAVDTVSGATYSSVGIIQAVNDALAKAAKKAGNKDDPGTDNPGTDEPGRDDPGKDNPGTDEPGKDNPGTDNPGTDNPGTDNPPQTSEPVSITKTVTVYCDEDEDFDNYALSVTIVIKDGVITDMTNAVQLKPERTNDSFIRAALSGIKAKLVGQSSADGVDSVSGATCTSLSLIQAAREALQEAAVSAGQ